MKGATRTLCDKVPKHGAGSELSLGNMLSTNTSMPQGATLPPHEALNTSCIFDKQFPRERLFLIAPYPGDTVQIHNLLGIMFGYVEQSIKQRVMYPHLLKSVGGNI